MASASEPEQPPADPESSASFGLPPDFITRTPKQRREVVWALAQVRSRTRDPQAEAVRRSGVDGEPGVVPALTVALETDPDKLVKRHAAYGLASVADPAIIPPLRGALALPDRATKGHAILGLGRRRAREAVPDLVALLDDHYASLMAADALVAIGDERGLPAIRGAAGRGLPLRRHRLRRRVWALEAALGQPPSGEAPGLGSGA